MMMAWFTNAYTSHGDAYVLNMNSVLDNDSIRDKVLVLYFVTKCLLCVKLVLLQTFKSTIDPT